MMANRTEPSRIGTFEQAGAAAELVVRKSGGEAPADPWAWWKAALAAPKEIGKSMKVSPSHPEQGFYRWKTKTSPWIPVAIWKDERGEWLALRGQQRNERMVDAVQEWEYCCGHPITQIEYELVAEQGQEWSDADPTVGAHLRARRPGSNEPVDEAEILKDQIESAKQGAEKYAKFQKWMKRGKVDVPVVESLIKDDDTAGKAQSLRSRLLELFREGETKFHKEKDPITKRGKEVDDRWRFRDEAQEQADIIRAALEIYETAKLEARRQQEEAARKAAAEAERKREDAELSFVPQPAAPEPAPPPAPSPAPETTIKGGYGRAATIGVTWDVKEITDQAALYQFMREHKELKAKLFELAQRALDAGHEVPGITKKERATVR